MSLDAAALTELFAAHRDLLWGLGYRMLGSAADADEVVQETFVRLLERPPADTRAALRPWLLRVGSNLARDMLRRRRVRGYDGPWLPSPVPDTRLGLAYDAPEARYELAESAGFAFLLALEALNETQRAVLVLRDVFDLSTAEAADALELSTANVKTTLHRARRALADYDADRRRLSPERVARTGEALHGFATALAAGDREAVLGWLADDAVALNDGGGEFVAARLPVRGAAKVAALYLGVVGQRGGVGLAAPVVCNGVPILIYEGAPPRPDYAPRGALRVEVDATGRKIVAVHSILASAKLTAIPRLEAD